MNIAIIIKSKFQAYFNKMHKKLNNNKILTSTAIITWNNHQYNTNNIYLEAVQ